MAVRPAVGAGELVAQLQLLRGGGLVLQPSFTNLTGFVNVKMKSPSSFSAVPSKDGKECGAHETAESGRRLLEKGLSS